MQPTQPAPGPRSHGARTAAPSASEIAADRRPGNLAHDVDAVQNATPTTRTAAEIQAAYRSPTPPSITEQVRQENERRAALQEIPGGAI